MTRRALWGHAETQGAHLTAKVRVTMSDSNGQRSDATVEDVARHFGVSERTVWRWLTATDIPHRKVGATTRFNLDEVDEWAARGGRPSDDGAPAEKAG